MDGMQRRDDSPTGSRFGHRPVLHAVLGRQILDAHLRNRHQLLDAGPIELHTVEAAEARLLIRAMAAAAQADGGLDEKERQRIASVIRASALDEEERGRMEERIGEPHCLEELIRQVDTPRLASRVYAVSLAVVDKSAAVNQAYLRYLALRLGLPADLVVRLNRQMGLRL
ncbi:DUF533 domain-containing protein [Azospirillum picis]|nr:DUF533 domain-containing protein [Azospirillum picis]